MTAGADRSSQKGKGSRTCALAASGKAAIGAAPGGRRFAELADPGSQGPKIPYLRSTTWIPQGPSMSYTTPIRRSEPCGLPAGIAKRSLISPRAANNWRSQSSPRSPYWDAAGVLVVDLLIRAGFLGQPYGLTSALRFSPLKLLLGFSRCTPNWPARAGFAVLASQRSPNLGMNGRQAAGQSRLIAPLALVGEADWLLCERSAKPQALQ